MITATRPVSGERSDADLAAADLHDSVRPVGGLLAAEKAEFDAGEVALERAQRLSADAGRSVQRREAAARLGASRGRARGPTAAKKGLVDRAAEHELELLGCRSAEVQNLLVDAHRVSTIGTKPPVHALSALRHSVHRLAEERGRRSRFIASRLLWRTRLGDRLGIRIPVAEGVNVRFGPSAFAATLWLDHNYALQERRRVRELVDPGDTVIDVGANIGVLALVAAAKVGPNGRVVAIEPHPRTYAMLERNVRDARLPWVRTVQAALGATTGEVTISNLRSDDQNRVVVNGGGPHVPLRPLDEVVGNVGPVGLVKVDVEGYETAVLRGAQATLGRTRTVLLECSTELAARHGFDPNQALDLLEAAGFILLDVETLEPLSRPWRQARARDVLATRDRLDVLRRFRGGGLVE